MGLQNIYKNIIFRDETTWGTSVAGTTRTLQIVSSSLNANPNKTLVEDTRTSNKGRDRMVRLKNEIDGDIVAYSSPEVLNFMFETVNGSAGTTSAVGTSAILITYNQNTDGNMTSVTLVEDRNNSQEVFYGVRGKKLAMKASDGLVESTLTVMAKTRGAGATLANLVGETVKPLVFADMVITMGLPGYTQVSTLLCEDWSLEYDNGLEKTFLSGDRNAARMDQMVPMVSGQFTIFHEGSSYLNPTYGSSEVYIRIEGIYDSSEGLIAGVTPYYLRIDIPRAEITLNERNFEQGALAKEVISFTAMFDQGTSTLWKPQLTTGFDIEAA